MSKSFATRAHGTAKDYGAGPRIEIGKPEDISTGVALPVAERVAANVPEALALVPRKGRITPEQAAELGRKGGRAKAANNPKRWGAALHLGGLLELKTIEGKVIPVAEYLKPFMRENQRWLRVAVQETADLVGAGFCSAKVVSVLTTAAWQRMFSRVYNELACSSVFVWEIGEDGKRREPRTDLSLVAARLGDAHRQNLLAAHELCARETEARLAADRVGRGGKLPPWFVQQEDTKKETKP